MGSFDGAELCELVGLFLLSGLASIIGKSNVGLYRDDGLAILENTPGPDTERIKKKIIKFFQQNGLKITIDANVIEAIFLTSHLIYNLINIGHIGNQTTTRSIFIQDRTILPLSKSNYHQCWLNDYHNSPATSTCLTRQLLIIKRRCEKADTTTN